ncbi:MAG: excinuclease ABC subunit UvrC [Candidatus Margulisiibacteriota bacterium]
MTVPDHLKKIINDLPDLPGIYQMMDSQGQIIYVGKAKNIKKRVRSYFTGRRDYKTTVLVKNIHSIEPIITKSEHDALLLENNLIKQHQPQFNVLLKDDKTYPFIKITLNEPFPRIIITRQRLNDKARYFGPYTSYGSSRKLKQLIYDVFPIRDCKQAITLTTQQKKCIKLDIGKCIGPCIYKEAKPEYDRLIEQCIQFLEGKSSELIDSLNEQMNDYSGAQNYEKAALIRDRIKRLETIQAQQYVELDTNQHYFFIGFSSNEHYHYGVCQHFANKRFISQHGKYTSLETNFSEFTTEFIQSVIRDSNQKINIILNKDCPVNSEIFTQHQDKTISVITPSKGRHFELLTMAELNAQKSLIGISKNAITRQLISPIAILKQTLKLQRSPAIIFGCDISHYYGTGIVSSVVVFIDGKPDKSYYRHFNIKSVTSGKSDDVKSMHETVLRLIDHFDILPQLLLIDGGKGQLNAALAALKEKNITTIDCIGLAKRNEEIFTPFSSSPICLPYHHRGLNLLRFVRDEAHRFALNFQRKKRQL